jgi:hypothetical protein
MPYWVHESYAHENLQLLFGTVEVADYAFARLGEVSEEKLMNYMAELALFDTAQ